MAGRKSDLTLFLLGKGGWLESNTLEQFFQRYSETRKDLLFKLCDFLLMRGSQFALSNLKIDFFMLP